MQLIDKNIEQKTVTLCEKIQITQIYSPTNVWKDFHKIFNLIQKEVILASNKVMATCNMYNSFPEKEVANKWLEDTYNSNKLRNILYEVARTYSVSMYSRNANSISNDIYKRYFSGANSYKNSIANGTGNPPMTYTESCPLPITAQGSKLECTDYDKGYYTLELPLLNQSTKNGVKYISKVKTEKGNWKDKETIIPVNSGRLKFGFCVSRNQRLSEIVTNIMNGTYKLGDSKLKRVESKKSGKKYDYYLMMSYTKPVKEVDDLDEEKILGVDIGVVVPAYCAVNYCDYRRKSCGDNRIIRMNVAQEQMNRKHQKRIKYNLRDGHGRKYKLDGFDGSGNKINNRNDTYNFNLASEVIGLALQWKCGTIHMEDLHFGASVIQDRFLKNWTYYDMQKKIENKAKENGINVKYINPRNTSKTCSCCGNLEEGQRLTQSDFVCKKCGYKVNADFNAARNIAMSTKFI